MKGMKIVLVGHAASGKDYFRKILQDKGLKFAVTHTTRPIRPEEEDGVDCHFITQKEFIEKIQLGDFLEHDNFNGWYYGTTTKTFQDSDVFIMTPKGVGCLKEEDRRNTLVIFIDIPELTRLERLTKRVMPGDSKSRRIAADRVDFARFTDYDIHITNPKF